MIYTNNDERKSRLENIFTTAATVGLAAIAFNKVGARKLFSKSLDDIGKVGKNVIKDISSHTFRELDGKTISKIVEDNKKLYKEIKKDSGKIKLDPSRGLFENLQKLEKLKAKDNALLNQMKEAATKDLVMKDLKEQYKDQTNEFFESLKDLVNVSLDKKSKFFEEDENGVYKAINKRFNDFMEGSSLEKEKDAISKNIEDALNKAKDSKVLKDLEEDFNSKTTQNLTKEFEKNLIENNHKGFFDDVLERAATVNDLINAAEKDKISFEGFNKSINGEDPLDIIKTLKSIRAENEELGNLVIDPKTLRVHKGELYSSKGFNDFTNVIKEEISDTIPGKIFSLRSFVDKAKAPDFNYFAKGSYDATLAKAMGSEDGILKDDMFFIAGKFYKHKEGELFYQKQLDDLQLVSGVHGSFQVLNNKIHGNFFEKEQNNVLFKKLDINTTGETRIEKIKGKFSKFKSDSDWLRNVVNRFEKQEYKDDFAMLDDLAIINKMFSDKMTVPSEHSIKGLKESLGGEAKNVLKALDQDDPLKYLSQNNIKIFNLDLKSLLTRYEHNQGSLENLVKIGDLGGHKGLNVLKKDDLIKREIVKNALLVDAGKRGTLKGYSVTLDKIRTSNLNKTEKKEISNLLFWGNLQSKGKQFNSQIQKVKTREERLEIVNKIRELMDTNSTNPQIDNYLISFRKSMKEFAKEHTSIFGDSIANEVKQANHTRPNSQWITMRKTKGLNSNKILEDLNNGIKKDSNTRKFIRQFYAGRNNPEDITMATLLPYHFVSRLTTPLEELGLGFGPKSTGSVGALSKNLFLKRILPAVGLMYGASYLNYEAENLTGTSFTEAKENAKARWNIGIKTIQENLGMDDSIRRNRMYNPIMQYWFQDYKDKDEYLDYLENGYDPVRKGRFWSFGSTSEFRGGKVSYWQPNSYRKAHSHYRDIAIYGSEDEKWKHSLIPTLRHPFSTLRYLSDPYWLEKKHYYDRPYPVSGKMFSEGSLWGAVLNPTIGNLIKPQIKMHKEELSENLKDPNSIVTKLNEAIKERSSEARVMRLDQDGVTPMFFAPKSMPSLSESVFSLNIKGNNIKTIGFEGTEYADNLGSMEDMHIAKSSEATNGGDGVPVIGGVAAYVSNADRDKDTSERIDILSSLLIQGTISNNSANEIISNLNDNTIKRGNYKSGVIVERARQHINPYMRAAEEQKNKIISNLNLDATGDTMHDIVMSGKELSGIYGFLFDQVVPEKKGYRLAQAGDINSFSRQFWDASVGGIGGEFMEIARRLFPHEDHNIENINPLRNTMPLWLPDRFWTGDPYTKVPDGEARLPGQGYEALNKLHPDKYGRYGAFDRFKILADVAPTSEEYKIWKKIVKEESNDPNIRKQIDQVEKRVQKQVKQHDFFNYKFLGKDFTTKKAVIEEISKDGAFKIVGDNRNYTIAGLQFNNNILEKYLKPGMEVQLKYEDNEYTNVNDKGQISSLVMINGENLGKKIWMNKDAKEINDDYKTTLADNVFAAEGSNFTMGKVWEAIGHAPIPYIHNKYLRINSPMESYKHEQVYGSSYATWDHPIEGFVKPAFREAWARGPIAQLVGVGAWALSANADKLFEKDINKKLAHTAFALANPGAFAGGVIGALPKMTLGSHSSIWNAKKGANIGAAVGLAGYAFSNLDNPFLSMGNFAAIGLYAADHLKTNIYGKAIGKKEGAMIGAAVGLGLSALKNPEFSLDKLTEKYIPEKTKKKWEIEEYYDRLNYIKYQNLFEKTARLAKLKEGVDVEKIINKFEYNREKNAKKIEKLQKQKSTINKYVLDTKLRNGFDALIDKQIFELVTPEQYFKAGEYTKSALAYKKAADTTIYGLSKFSNKSDILRALPKYDRDYFLEFAKEKDPKERKKILKMISPYKQKALKILWGEDIEKNNDNKSYFRQHTLPGLFWAGWRADVDLENVKMKTIENEGMMLSDFGIYESQKEEPAAISAPEIKNINDGSSALGLQAKLTGMLSGLGLSGLDVSVEPSDTKGINIFTNIMNIGTYNVKEKVNTILYNSIL